MAFRTQVLFPAIPDIYRMDELHGFIDRGILHIMSRTLGNNSVAKIAILGNDPSFIAFHPVVMTAKTSVGFEMADMIQVTG